MAEQSSRRRLTGAVAVLLSPDIKEETLWILIQGHQA